MLDTVLLCPCCLKRSVLASVSGCVACKQDSCNHIQHDKKHMCKDTYVEHIGLVVQLLHMYSAMVRTDITAVLSVNLTLTIASLCSSGNSRL